MFENRASQRYRTMGQAKIHGVLEGEVLLKDLSITGCCLECTVHPEKIKPNEIYQVDIEPETAANVEGFSLQAECRWIRHGDYSFEIGFQVTASPKGKCFQRYVDYLAYHSSLE
ncbi:MAG: PilZ domain-containing protein [Treponema sp.]|jgi:hypothetical protein|nr:PilZ domain-containing protein [Treponema sp.]